MKISMTLKGNLASKSNSRRLVYAKGNMSAHRPGSKYAFIKSERAMRFQEGALLQIKKQHKLGITEPVCLTAHIYYDSWRPDLDDTLLCDILEKAGVIKNDRLIVEKHLWRHLDKDNPRVELTLETIDGDTGGVAGVSEAVA